MHYNQVIMLQGFPCRTFLSTRFLSFFWKTWFLISAAPYFFLETELFFPFLLGKKKIALQRTMSGSFFPPPVELGRTDVHDLKFFQSVASRPLLRMNDFSLPPWWGQGSENTQFHFLKPCGAFSCGAFLSCDSTQGSHLQQTAVPALLLGMVCQHG
jgi:hypothetical protein